MRLGHPHPGGQLVHQGQELTGLDLVRPFLKHNSSRSAEAVTRKTHSDNCFTEIINP